MEVKNYVLGKWVSGSGNGVELFHAITGEHLGNCSSEGLDF